MATLLSELTYKYALESEKKFQHLMSSSFDPNLEDNHHKAQADQYTPRIHRATVLFRPGGSDSPTLFIVHEVSAQLDVDLAVLQALAEEQRAHVLTYLFTARPAHAETTAKHLNLSLTTPAYILTFRPAR